MLRAYTPRAGPYGHARCVYPHFWRVLCCIYLRLRRYSWRTFATLAHFCYLAHNLALLREKLQSSRNIEGTVEGLGEGLGTRKARIETPQLCTVARTLSFLRALSGARVSSLRVLRVPRALHLSCARFPLLLLASLRAL